MTDADPERVRLTGGTVVDGTGAAPARRDVMLEHGRIAAVAAPGALSRANAAEIDVTGMVVAPGFIDVHSHADASPFLDFDDTTKVLQGVTTEVVGNCGASPPLHAPGQERVQRDLARKFFPDVGWPNSTMPELLAATDGHGYPTNYVPLVGHNVLRAAAMGMAQRPAGDDELRAMTRLLAECIDAGVFGLSSGLIYPPGAYSTTAELSALAGSLPAGRLYATHMRSEGTDLLAGVAEAVEVTKRSGCRTQVSHLKATGEGGDLMPAAIRLLTDARAGGMPIAQDVYPYTASSTALSACLPPWAHAGGDQALLGRLANAGELDSIRTAVESDTEPFANQVSLAGYDGILVSSTASHSFEGKTLAQIGAELDIDGFGALIHVLRREELSATMVVFKISEAGLLDALADPCTMVGSDGLPVGIGGRPHPRLYGTFPRVLGEFVRRRSHLELATAVRRMTGLPADVFAIPDRGYLAEGKIADLVVFDADTVDHDTDYLDPARPVAGIHHVFHAGRPIVRDGRWLGRRRGRRLQPG